MLGSEENENSKEKSPPSHYLTDSHHYNPPKRSAYQTPQTDLNILMSEVELKSPQPATSGESKLEKPPDKPGRTPSPRCEIITPSKLKNDQIDALPIGIKTPKKTPGTPVSIRADDKNGQIAIIKLEVTPSFSDVDEGQWSKLFSRKITQCEQMVNWNEQSPSQFGSIPTNHFDNDRNREIKTLTLNDLLFLIPEHVDSLQEHQYQELFRMISKNIFRPIPPYQNPAGEMYDPEDDEPIYDPSWPHLQIVYEILIRFIESPHFNVNIAKKYVDQTFVFRLLNLFDVEDPRERDMVKTSVHRIYGKFLNLRAFIRKSMRHIFYEFIYEDERHYIAEMLEILGSVVNGFAIPLREEHKIFLERTLIPLHKNRLLPCYFAQLSLCIVQFAEKDPGLIEKIILGLLRLWPKTNTTKEMMFLNEIEEILDVTPPQYFTLFMVPLSHQLAKSISSSHFQVAERALHYWSNEYIISLLSDHIETIMPIILPAMLKYSRNHWNKNVQLQVFNGLRLFMDMNPKLYEVITSSFVEEENGSSTSRTTHRQQWIQVEAIAQRKYSCKTFSEEETSQPKIILSSDRHEVTQQK